MTPFGGADELGNQVCRRLQNWLSVNLGLPPRFNMYMKFIYIDIWVDTHWGFAPPFILLCIYTC